MLSKIERKHLGAGSELVACAWLLAEGYEVFRNISQHGLADLVAVKDGKAFYFDVKSQNDNHSYRRLSPAQIERGILPLVVSKSGECVIDWSPKPIGYTGEPRPCKNCGDGFVPGKSNNLRQLYCSQKCALDQWRQRQVGEGIAAG